jgi:hypothetical protein
MRSPGRPRPGTRSEPRRSDRSCAPPVAWDSRRGCGSRRPGTSSPRTHSSTFSTDWARHARPPTPEQISREYQTLGIPCRHPGPITARIRRGIGDGPRRRLPCRCLPGRPAGHHRQQPMSRTHEWSALTRTPTQPSGTVHYACRPPRRHPKSEDQSDAVTMPLQPVHDPDHNAEPRTSRHRPPLNSTNRSGPFRNSGSLFEHNRSTMDRQEEAVDLRFRSSTAS